MTRFTCPMSMGTRCHQLAMYIIYISPLQMLCDTPGKYYREEEFTEFISEIPTIWDESVVLEAAGPQNLHPPAEWNDLPALFRAGIRHVKNRMG